MKVIDHIDITDAMVLANSVVETDAMDGPEWDSATTYADGARVRRSALHKSFISAAAGNVGNVPETSTLKWVDDGSTNPWRMLRTDSDVPTVAPSPLVLTLAPGRRFSAAAIVRLRADRIRFTTSTGYSSGWRRLRRRDTTSWSGYFFGEFLYREMELILDMPLASGQSVTVEIERDTGDVECGPMLVGRPVYLGNVNLGATAGTRDFSVVERDRFGNAKLQPGKSIPRSSQTSVFDKAQTNQVRRTLDGMRGRAGFFFGIDDATDAYFESLAMLGILQDWQINFDEQVEASVSLQLEGY